MGQLQFFANDCSGLRMAMEQQLQRMQMAESAMQGNCDTGSTQECSETTAGWNSQASLYRALQSRYRSCLAQTGSFYSFGSYLNVGFQSDLLFEPLGVGPNN